MAPGDGAVDRLPDTNEEETPACSASPVWRKDARDDAAHETKAGDTEVVPEVGEGERRFEWCQMKKYALTPGVPIERREAEVDCRETGTVDDHQLAALERR